MVILKLLNNNLYKIKWIHIDKYNTKLHFYVRSVSIISHKIRAGQHM